MPSKDKDQIQLLQGTLDLIVLRTLATMGSQHAYQIATRLQQISDSLLNLNQGTLYPALVRLEQYGWIKGPGARPKTIARRNTTKLPKPDKRPWVPKPRSGEPCRPW